MNRFQPVTRPEDEVCVLRIDDWEIFISRSTKRLYINTMSYHPPILELSRDDLRMLLDKMDEMI